MKWFSIIAVLLFVLAACVSEESRDSASTPKGPRGKSIIFRSDADGHVLALYPDDGHLLFYGDVLEVGGPSDLGGNLEACGEGISECVELADSIYLMVPPLVGARWAFRGYDFHLVGGSSDPSNTVVVYQHGDERYSYSYSRQCGVEWINLSTGGKNGKRLYYPVGRSLFSGAACAVRPKN